MIYCYIVLTDCLLIFEERRHPLLMKIQTFSLGPMQTNCYFIIDEATNRCAVVDPGEECGRILDALSSHQLTIEMILLTHGHFDHIMALDELRKTTGVPVLIHKDDADALLEPSISYMLQFAGKDKREEPADKLLEDGDVLKLGESEIKVMHTPGHTPGSVCYICGDKIVSGDTLFRGSIGRYDLHGGNYAVLCKSLKKLVALDGDYRIYPGHGSSTTLDNERRTNLYLQ